MCFDTASDISIVTEQVFGKLPGAQLTPCTSTARNYSNNEIDLLHQAMVLVAQDDVAKTVCIRITYAYMDVIGFVPFLQGVLAVEEKFHTNIHEAATYSYGQFVEIFQQGC